jgi:hypothetical protein
MLPTCTILNEREVKAVYKIKLPPEGIEQLGEWAGSEGTFISVLYASNYTTTFNHQKV